MTGTEIAAMGTECVPGNRNNRVPEAGTAAGAHQELVKERVETETTAAGTAIMLTKWGTEMNRSPSKHLEDANVT